eukprot:1428713-Pyramimonas_sp.AAC.1
MMQRDTAVRAHRRCIASGGPDRGLSGASSGFGEQGLLGPSHSFLGVFWTVSWGLGVSGADL